MSPPISYRHWKARAGKGSISLPPSRIALVALGDERPRLLLDALPSAPRGQSVAQLRGGVDARVTVATRIL